jgi:hypothetical protein
MFRRVKRALVTPVDVPRLAKAPEAHAAPQFRRWTEGEVHDFIESSLQPCSTHPRPSRWMDSSRHITAVSMSNEIIHRGRPPVNPARLTRYDGTLDPAWLMTMKTPESAIGATAGRWPFVNGLGAALLSPGKVARQKRHLAVLGALRSCGMLPKATHASNINKLDGGGSQVHQTLAVRAFCRALDIPYAHRAFSAMEHARGPDEVERWEQLFGLGQDSPRADDLPMPLVSLPRFVRNPWLWRRPCVLTGVEVHPFIAANPGAYDSVRVDARRNYRGVPPPREDDGTLAVAVHVRRGDAVGKANRFTPDAVVVRWIAAVQEAASRLGWSTTVTVFSQGAAGMFSAYVDTGARLSLDGDPLDAINRMVHADVLIMARSSFSYVAGLLNTHGVVLCEPHKHPPMRDWEVVVGAPDPGVLGAAIHRRLGLPTTCRR